MTPIGYHSPFVPPEWIAAHGFRPHWMRLRSAAGGPPGDVVRGVCPFAGAFLHAVLSGTESSAVVMATTCDQMRHAAGLLARQSDTPVFLLSVPSTWQTPVAKELYYDELKRLGRFLVHLGGRAPVPGELANVMVEYEEARGLLRAIRHRPSARQFALAVVAVRNGGKAAPDLANRAVATEGIPLAIVGGPLLEEDYAMLDLIEEAGGRLVLDATEGGERTLPAVFDRQGLQDDPLAELADVYNRTIPDAFRRPNNRFYEWILHETAAREVRGILVRRYTWCDIWHAELHRFKENCPVPVLDIDSCHDDDGVPGRIAGRIEAFLEMLG